MHKLTPLSKWFFYALVLFLPIGTHKIFFSPQSFYFGYHAFYNTFYIYLTDLLFLGLMLTWLWELRGKISVKFNRINVSLIVFWLILAISYIISPASPTGGREISLGIYGLIKITQYLLLFVYVSSSERISREISRIFWLILATFSMQSVIAIGQYLTQSSLGLHFLGEEWLRPGLRGIAEFVFGENILIRGYGTLPHPNVLGGLLFVGIMGNLYLLYISQKSTPPSLPYSRGGTGTGSPPKIGGVRGGILFASLILLSTALVVTFSRIAWAVAGMAIITWFFMIFVKIRKPYVLAMRTGHAERFTETYNPKGLAIVVLALLAAFILNIFLFGPTIKSRLVDAPPKPGTATVAVPNESVVNRGVYNKIALRMITGYPAAGVGLRSFVVAMDDFSDSRLLPHMHQPVHNIYLLIAAESGIFAFLAFCVVIYNIVRPHLWRDRPTTLIYTLLIALFGLLLIGLFDHYLWSIQQGSMALWIMLGLVAANKQQKTAISPD